MHRGEVMGRSNSTLIRKLQMRRSLPREHCLVHEAVNILKCKASLDELGGQSTQGARAMTK